MPSSAHRKHAFINRQSYVTETTQTQTSFANGKGSSTVFNQNKEANAKLLHESSIGNERAQRRSKLEVESELNDPERTFEVVVGGCTGASIFYDNTHARHEEEKEFDRLYGAR